MSIGPDGGVIPGTGQMSAGDRLSQLKVVLDTIGNPLGPVIQMTAPGVYDPHVIVPRLVDQYAKWNILNTKLSMLDAEFKLMDDAKLSVSPLLLASLNRFEDEVADYMNSLA